MSISKASAQWDGSFKAGKGSMKPAHGADVPFSVASRFEGTEGSSPEELVGAALAGCYSMALTLSLGAAGLNPEKVRTAATVHLDRDGAGYKISSIELTTVAKVPGAEASKFASIAEETKKACPVSKALGGTQITLKASLD